MRLIERIKNAIAAGKVEYWGERPENLPRADLDEAFQRNPELTEFQRKERESGDGTYGLTGEDYVYSGKVIAKAFGKIKNFYMKFFFLEKG
jgi:hypothetical protein